MKDKQWVQHISGQGEKWEVSGRLYNQSGHDDWQVVVKSSRENYHYLPKSEYRLCEPPERWEDVTERCCVDTAYMDHEKWNMIFHDAGVTVNNISYPAHGYRLRKVKLYGGPIDAGNGDEQWAFIVEKKVQP